LGKPFLGMVLDLSEADMAQAIPNQSEKHLSPLAQLRLWWRIYLTVESDDLVQQVLNRGLLHVLAWFCLLISSFVVVNLISANWFFVSTSLLFLGLFIVIIWRARRGSQYGAVPLAVAIAVSTAIVFEPGSYIEPVVIHVVFLLPSLILTLFVRPVLGFAGVFCQIVTLLIALWIANISPQIMLEFTYYATLDLLGLTIPLFVAARVFRRAINRLAQSNEELDTRVNERTAELQSFMALRESDIKAAVHDLNNRMTVVRAEIDELLFEAGEAGMQEQSIRTANERLTTAMQGVSHLLYDLRTAVLLDNQALQLRRAPFALDLLTERVVSQFSTQAAHWQCTLNLSVTKPPLIINGDEGKIERVLVNIIGNALKYTRQMPAGQRLVDVQVLASQIDGATIIIADTGPGLHADAMALLGQPFSRFSSARGTEGMGLGVYISRGIVEHHGGSLHYLSPAARYSTQVEIWLPHGNE
jgi:signal transduction histidine kinase